MSDERRVWSHWQNLSEEDRKYRFPFNGRAWLHFGSEVLSVEWNLLSRSCGVSLAAEPTGERTWSASVKLPPIALYFGAKLAEQRILSRLAAKVVEWIPGDMDCSWSGRRFDISVHDWAVWWHLFVDDSGWTSKRPKWRDGSFNIQDFFLGKQSYESTLIKKDQIVVAMPEGNYKGTCELREDSWTRPRGPTKIVHRAHIEMQDPIPIPGKGENAWDCGEDAIYGSSFQAKTFAEAVAGITASALKTRERHGGRRWSPESKSAAE